MSEKLLEALREYHWWRVRMFDRMTADDRQVTRKFLFDAERKLNDVRDKEATKGNSLYPGAVSGL